MNLIAHPYVKLSAESEYEVRPPKIEPFSRYCKNTVIFHQKKKKDKIYRDFRRVASYFLVLQYLEKDSTFEHSDTSAQDFVKHL